MARVKKQVLTMTTLILMLCSCTSTSPTLVPAKPLFFGWFFNEQIAAGLQNITQGYLSHLYDQNPIFRNYLRLLSNQFNITNPLRYYAKPSDPNTGKYDPFYHITAHYCGNRDCTSYTSTVEQFLGLNFSTQLVGVFMTPRTYGIRVNLSREQDSIFDERTGRSMASRWQSSPVFTVPLGTSDVTRNSSSKYPGIDFEDQDSHNFKPTNSRAHVTLGCAPGVPAVTTGLDLLKILELEKTPGAFCQNFTQDNGTLVRMGENCDIFVYYLNQKMIANAEFQVYNSKSSRSRLAWYEYSIFGVSFMSVVKSVITI